VLTIYNSWVGCLVKFCIFICPEFRPNLQK